MRLRVKFRWAEVHMVLRRDDTVLAERRWPLNRDVSTRLLSELDQLLREQQLQLDAIKNVEVSADSEESSIVRSGIITAKVLGLALEEK